MPLLTLIGVVAFNIEVTIIYKSLKMHIKEALHPLQGESLEVFQEETKHIHNILINGIRNIRNCVQIESHLCEPFS